MKKIILILILSSVVFANFEQPTIPNLISNENTQQLIGTELPGFAKKLFGNERININILLNNGETLQVGLATESGMITIIQFQPITNPTLNAQTTETVIQTIIQSQNPLDTFQAALDNDNITYTAIGLSKKIKYGFISFVTRVASWFM